MLREGNIDEANRLLGRPFALVGTVEAGKRLGASIGFPTANVKPSYRAQLPGRGVYSVEVEMPGGEIRKGVANVGVQPTVGPGQQERVEVHIPGFEGDLYGQRLRVSFLRRLRDEREFGSLAELKAQIRKDIEEGRN